MIIVLKENRDQKALDDLRDWLRSLDLEIHYSQGTSTTLIGLVGDTSELDLDVIKSLDIVQNAIRIQDPYKIANRKFHSEDTVVGSTVLPLYAEERLNRELRLIHFRVWGKPASLFCWKRRKTPVCP